MEKDMFKDYTVEDHRKRLENIRYVHKDSKGYQFKHLIHDYIQGHVFLPDKYFNDGDEANAFIEKLAKGGVGLVQPWSMICEPATRWMHDERKRMYRPDLETAKKFIKMAHGYGMKVIPYTASNYHERNCQNFNNDWAYEDLFDLGHHLARCSPASPGWRDIILRQYTELMDEYGFDGIYNDTGYIRVHDAQFWQQYYGNGWKTAEDDVVAFEERDDYDGAMEDFLGLIYHEVHRRGGIIKLHKEGADTIFCDTKVYDYLTVGEAIRDIDFLRNKSKTHLPYVNTAFTYHLEYGEMERMLCSIPYMRFPSFQLDDTTGGPAEQQFPTADYLIPWLKLYQKMTVDGTWCFVDAKTPKIFSHNGEEVMSTYFANLELYMVIANFDYTPTEITLRDRFVEMDPFEGEKKIENKFTLPPRTMKVLRKIEDTYADTYTKMNHTEDLGGNF